MPTAAPAPPASSRRNTYQASNYFVDVVFSGGTINRRVANATAGFVTAENTPLAITTSSLLANDTDPQGYALSVTSVAPIAGTTHGTVSLSGSTITYTPSSATFTGADSFAYTISDGHGSTASTTVSLTVAAPPVANADSGFVTAENTPLAITTSSLPGQRHRPPRLCPIRDERGSDCRHDARHR